VQRLRWRRKSSRRDYALMLKQLHTLLAGGVPLADAVTSLTPNDASSLGVALVELNTGLRRGEPFARAFARCFPGIPGYVQRMLESGELSGRLAEAVADAAAAMEHTARVQAELRNALIYPAFLVGFGLLAIAFIFAIVVPRFAIMFRGRFDKLPWLSYAVIVTGMWVRSHWLLSTALIAGIGWAGVYLLWRPQSREAAFGVAMRLPVVHSWLIEIEIARWAAVLARLLEQRVSLIQSLELARLDLRSRDMRSRFARAGRLGAAQSARRDRPDKRQRRLSHRRLLSDLHQQSAGLSLHRAGVAGHLQSGQRRFERHEPDLRGNGSAKFCRCQHRAWRLPRIGLYLDRCADHGKRWRHL
jgi:general secretion pathway protein F